MASRREPWLVLAAVTLAGCDWVGFHLTNPELHTFAGARVIARVEVTGCRTSALPELVSADGGAAPAGFTAEASDGCGHYYLCNPGEAPPCGREIALPCANDRRFLTLTVAETVPVGVHTMAVHARGCHADRILPLALDVKGPLDLGGFCGASTGDACESDSGCSGPGAICSSTDVRPGWFFEEDQACVDPVPYGAECRCVQHACTWRLPD